jgi:uncharacterized protein
MPASARLLPDGKRLHLQHGPIDLIIGADGTANQVQQAYLQAIARFNSVLDELVSELPVLRSEIPMLGLGLKGLITRRMEQAVQPHWASRITPMAAVAGAVAQEILAALLAGTTLTRAFVNNGGDIAIHLARGEEFRLASPVGPVEICQEDHVHGIATSGWKGRSFSLGIAEAVTVLARSAAEADVAATLIANAVDLPGSPKITRQAACEIAPDSDLKNRLVTVAVGALDACEIEDALQSGLVIAQRLIEQGHIRAAGLRLSGCISFTPGPSPHLFVQAGGGAAGIARHRFSSNRSLHA